MSFNHSYAHQKHRLLESKGSLQRHHDLLFSKCSNLREALVFEVDPNILFKLKHALKESQEELEQVQFQLQQVLKELDRLDQIPDSIPRQKPLPSPPSHFPDGRKNNTRISLPPRPLRPSANPLPSKPSVFVLSVFVLSIAVVWLVVGRGSSVNLAYARLDKVIFLGLTERALVPVVPGAIGGLVSGLFSALAWLDGTRYRDKTQTILMGMVIGMPSGAVVWAIVWAFVRGSLGYIFGAIFGAVVGIAVLLWFDLKRTKV